MTDNSSASDFIRDHASQLFIVTDSNVEQKVLPLLNSLQIPDSVPRFIIPAGEEHKTPATLVKIWEWLAANRANRKSVLLNIGGGMVTDIGGFAAATFMRGVPYSNLPTTLLGAVDAAIGGKTAVNLGALKNQAGAFAMPQNVFFLAEPFSTLPEKELLSGFGELLKYGLIASPGIYSRMMHPEEFLENPTRLLPVVREAAAIKQSIVDEDPTEQGKRKVLNFGHTAGHAFESLALQRGEQLPHGVAVAHGLMVELILSHTLLGYPSSELYPLAMLIKESFPRFRTECKDNDRLISLMAHDKKNLSPDRINFTLLEGIARPVTDQIADCDEIATALDIYRDLTI